MSQGTAVYLYGVVRDGDPLVLDVPPISDAGPVYTLSHRGLAAVLSDGPLPQLRGDAHERPRARGGRSTA